MSHRINLKGPWDYDWRGLTDGRFAAASQSGTTSMPQEWRTLFGEVPGTARFRRKFHRPSNLEAHERVMLVFTEVRGSGSVRLNAHPVGDFIGTGQPVEFEITSLMNPFNELDIDITFDPLAEPSLAGGLSGVVALEIVTETTATESH